MYDEYGLCIECECDEKIELYKCELCNKFNNVCRECDKQYNEYVCIFCKQELEEYADIYGMYWPDIYEFDNCVTVPYYIQKEIKREDMGWYKDLMNEIYGSIIGINNLMVIEELEKELKLNTKLKIGNIIDNLNVKNECTTVRQIEQIIKNTTCEMEKIEMKKIDMEKMETQLEHIVSDIAKIFAEYVNWDQFENNEEEIKIYKFKHRNKKYRGNLMKMIHRIVANGIHNKPTQSFNKEEVHNFIRSCESKIKERLIISCKKYDKIRS